MEPLPYLEGQREEPPIAVQLNGLARGVDHHLAVVTTAGVCLDGPFQFRVQITVEIVRNFLKNFLAIQGRASLKTLLSSSRRRKRARKSRAFTALMVRPSTSAVSSVESSSTSRSMNTVRNDGGRA